LIYILLNDEKQGAWQLDYEKLYVREFEKLGNPLQQIKLKDVASLRERDFLWVMHYKDLIEVTKRRTQAKVISQINGTGRNPFTAKFPVNFDLAAERALYHNSIDIALIHHEKQLEAYKDFDCQKIVTGFPIEVADEYRNVKKIKKKIVISAKLSPEKMPYLNMHLMERFAREEYDIVFCIPNTESQKKWYHHYGIGNFRSFGYTFKFCNKEEFWQELSTAEFFFISTLGDTFSSALGEAYQCRCYCVVPKIPYPLPAYDELINIHYPLWDVEAISDILMLKPEYQFHSTYFNPTDCAIRLNRALNSI